MEQLDAWWKETAHAAARNPQEFLAGLAQRRRAAARKSRGEPADLARARGPVMRMAEGIAHWAQRQNDRAETTLQRTLQALEKQALQPTTTAGLPQLTRKLIGFCYVNLGNVEHNRGNLAAALRAYLHAREIALVAGITKLLGSVLGNIAMIYGEAGMWEKQLEFSRETRRIASAVNDEIIVGHEDMNVAFAYRKLRDFTAARQACERALQIARRNGWKADELNSHIILATIELAEGDGATAIRRLQAATGLSAEIDRPQYEAARLTELGRACLATGDLAGATTALMAVITRFANAMNFTEHADARLALARVHLVSRAFTDTAAQADEALRLLARSGMPNELEAEAHALLAEAGQARGDWELACREERARHEAYVRHFHHQADLHTRMLATQHQIDIARAAAERERIERQQLERLLADVATRLAAADSRPQTRNAEEITAADLQPLGLTPKESEVLLWVARGKTNSEIATILGRSDAVVKKHLKSIYQKLGVENRLSAAAAALQGRAGSATSTARRGHGRP